AGLGRLEPRLLALRLRDLFDLIQHLIHRHRLGGRRPGGRLGGALGGGRGGGGGLGWVGGGGGGRGRWWGGGGGAHAAVGAGAGGGWGSCSCRSFRWRSHARPRRPTPADRPSCSARSCSHARAGVVAGTVRVRSPDNRRSCSPPDALAWSRMASHARRCLRSS